MAQIISQNLTIPAGLADGSVAEAGQILPLYTAMNSFVIPDSIGVFKQAATPDDNVTVLTIGGTVTKDWTVVVPQLKSCFFMIPFVFSSVDGGAAGQLSYRVNGSAVTAASAGQFAVATSGAGMRVGFISARSSGIQRGVLIAQTDLTSFDIIPANADLPVAAITSIGVTWTVTAGTNGAISLKHSRFWAEG